MKYIKYLLIAAFVFFIVACYMMTTEVSPILSLAIGAFSMCLIGVASHIYEQSLKQNITFTNSTISKNGLIEGFR